MKIFKGIYTNLVIPFDSNNTVNYNELINIIDVQIKNGISGIVLFYHEKKNIFFI